jgi:hypothetical protein
MSADRSASTLFQQLSDAFTVYRRSVGDYHAASRGAASAHAVGVIEDSYRALVRLAVEAGLPTMPPRYVTNGLQGDWDGWHSWLRAVDDWWIEVEARLAVKTDTPCESEAPLSADPSAYIPAIGCRNERIQTAKQLNSLLKKMPKDPCGIRREHRGQHLFVHAGDWHRWNAKQEQLTEAVRTEAEETDKYAEEIERRKAQIRAESEAKTHSK